MKQVEINKIKSLNKLFKYISKIKQKSNITLAFRGEKEDYSILQVSR